MTDAAVVPFVPCLLSPKLLQPRIEAVRAQKVFECFDIEMRAYDCLKRVEALSAELLIEFTAEQKEERAA